MAANVPLVESGTAGYLGQVQPLLKVGLRYDLGIPLVCSSLLTILGSHGML
jgi:hypothetical protein